MSSIPVREMIKNAVEELGGRVSNKQIIEWVTAKYGDVNHGTIRTQTMACSVNQPSRVHLPECGKARGFDPRYDFLYRIERGQVEMYNPSKHGEWGIKERQGKAKITHNGRFLDISEIDEFFFVEKDFESATKNETDSRYLHARFKTLKEVLKNNLGEYFANSDSYVGHPFNQGSKEWNEYQWLGFWVTGTKEDSVQFQVSINKEDELSVFNWITEKSIKTKENVIKKIENNSEEFLSLIQKLPNEYGVGYKINGEYFEKKISEIDKEYLNKVKESLPKRDSEFYIVRYFSQAEAIEYETKIIGEISDTFEKLIPISNLLGVDEKYEFFILRHELGSRWDDLKGQKYHFGNTVANRKKLLNEEVIKKTIWYTKQNGEYYFWGYGTVKEIETVVNEEDWNLVYDDFKFFEKQDDSLESSGKFLKHGNESIKQEIENVENFNNQHSIIKITKKIYEDITGDKTTVSLTEHNTEIKKEFSKIIDILEWKKNVILYGPPGTGKTYTVNEVSKAFIPENSGNSQLTNQENRRHTWKTLTTLVLIENKGNALNYHEIADRILEKNIIETKGKTPHETLAKIMRDDIKNNGDESYFRNPSSGMYELNIPMTFKKAAEVILFANNKPMHYTEINDIALENQFVNTEGESPERTLGAVITRDIATNEDNSIFVSNGSGMYSLRRKNPVSSEIIEDIGHSKIRMVTFHPSYSYEDFIEGIRPKMGENDNVIYELKDGIFKEICENARNNKNENYLLIIDEINRGNISKIFGELITLIENDKRGKDPVTLAYSQDEFDVPDNLYIIGTMNTADKSLIQIDAALRRRFAFMELMPNENLTELDRKVGKVHLGRLLRALNKKIIEQDLRDKQIGHSYFMNIPNGDVEVLKQVFRYEIIPLLQDYFYENYNLLEEVLGKKIISKEKMTVNEELINDSEKFQDELLKIISGKTNDDTESVEESGEEPEIDVNE